MKNSVDALLFTIHTTAQDSGQTIAYYPARFFHTLQEASSLPGDFFLAVASADVEVVRDLSRKLEKHDHTVLDLRTLIVQMRSLKALQHQSALRFLGYFAVPEALLTHDPTGRSVRFGHSPGQKKVALLNNRWTRRLNYAPFGGASRETVWGAMYAYRSKVAHGAIADFKGNLQVLGNREQALKLLIDTVKATMRFGLDEPQLLVDLREC